MPCGRRLRDAHRPADSGHAATQCDGPVNRLYLVLHVTQLGLQAASGSLQNALVTLDAAPSVAAGQRERISFADRMGLVPEILDHRERLEVAQVVAGEEDAAGIQVVHEAPHHDALVRAG